jgi:HAD superfamily 5'-nucleotidase-like hydrolase
MSESKEQLPLPLGEFREAQSAPRTERVFCNRHLKMSQISWIGFDMDYTLAIYDQDAMDKLSIDATLTKLVARGYPDFILNVTHDTQFPVRGLLIDKKFGHVLKMDRYKYVCRGFHGFRELSKAELRELYHAKKLRPATSRYHWVDTLYALSEVAVYTALVDAHEAHGLALDYAKLFSDIRECIDEAHRDGTILDAITSDLPKYVTKDPELASTLHKWRSSGKRLFLVTNSRWSYSEKMMTYLLEGMLPEYPSWRNYFDLVLVAARKPGFFQEMNPIMERSERSDSLKPASFPLMRGKVYEGGNVHDLERAMGALGDEVLYIGDHIYGDILRSKKESAWRTVKNLIPKYARTKPAEMTSRKTASLPRTATDLRKTSGSIKAVSKTSPKRLKPIRRILTSAPSERATSTPSIAFEPGFAKSTVRQTRSSAECLRAFTRTGARCSKRPVSNQALASRLKTTLACIPHGFQTLGTTRRNRRFAAPVMKWRMSFRGNA